jgi:hypothetical protein
VTEKSNTNWFFPEPISVTFLLLVYQFWGAFGTQHQVLGIGGWIGWLGLFGWGLSGLAGLLAGLACLGCLL